MTLDDLIAWQNGNYKARVRLGAGVDPSLVPVLASKLSGVRAVAPEVDHYDDASGLRITATGQDSDGTPIYEIGSPPPGSTRLSGYDDLEKAMAGMASWGGRKPQATLDPPTQRPLSQPLREKLLATMGGAPTFDRQGSARRGLESGALAGAIAALAGGDGLAVGSALRGASRGVDRAFAGRYQDDLSQWKAGVSRDSQAVKLDDTRTNAMNKSADAGFAHDRDAANLGLKQWEAEGRGLHNAFLAAAEELKAQQSDAKQGANVAELAAKRQDLKVKAIQSANHDMVSVFAKLGQNERVSQYARREFMKRIGIIQDSTARGELAPDWVYELGPDWIADMSPEDKAKLDQTAERLKQGGVRLKIQERNAATAEKRLGLAAGALSERARHNQVSEKLRTIGKAIDPITGPKAGAAETYQYLVKNHDQLLEQKREIMPRLGYLEAEAKRRELTDSEFFEHESLKSSSDTLTRYLQSVTNRLAVLESQYPQMRANVQKRVGDKNMAREYRGPTMDKKFGVHPAPKKPAPKKPAYMDVPGVGRVPIER